MAPEDFYRAKGDKNVCARFRQVSGDSFDSFFRQRFSKTVVMLIAMGASRAEAEDAAQDAMLLAWQQWESIREPAAWVRATAVRVFWKYARARRSDPVPMSDLPDVPSDNPWPGIFGEEQWRVLSLLRALPPGQREVTALFYDGMPCEEIAALTGKPSGTVRSQLRHARKTLKEKMQRE
jgi:RNA polymerase sigma factor (sigma-70 family)